MWTDKNEVVLTLSLREAQDLFARLLKSHEEDTDESRAVLKALANLLERTSEAKAA